MNIRQLVDAYVRLKRCGMECAAREKLEQIKCKINHKKAAHHLPSADLPSSHRWTKNSASLAMKHIS